MVVAPCRAFQPLRRLSLVAIGGIYQLPVEDPYGQYPEKAPISASNSITGGKMMVWESTDRLSQCTQKEAHLGVERTAGIHRWSFDHGGIYPTSVASIQAEECA